MGIRMGKKQKRHSGRANPDSIVIAINLTQTFDHGSSGNVKLTPPKLLSIFSPIIAISKSPDT